MNTTNNEAVERAALAIREARASGKPIPPVSKTFGLSGVETAYRIAELNVQARVADGHRIVGKKVGLTSLAVQKQLGVDQPDFGVLFDDMEYLSAADIPMTRLIQPKVEAEVAFVMASDLGSSAPTWSSSSRQ